MVPGLEERTKRYIVSVQAGYLPGEKSYWQHPAPAYHPTSDYAVNYDKVVDTSEPVLFKRSRREWLIALVMLVVAAVLIYLVSKNEFGVIQFMFLVLVLLVVLPRLLDNKAMIRIGPESIWLYKEDKEIDWEYVILTYIKEVREEATAYFFSIHYYDRDLDDFRQIEIELKGLVSPAILSATVEAFRKDGKSAA